ncbi:hypothetical protein NKDENANG_01493 [Candidatus Entotheonellaceae bacterium PAL068K]
MNLAASKRMGAEDPRPRQYDRIEQMATIEAAAAGKAEQNSYGTEPQPWQPVKPRLRLSGADSSAGNSPGEMGHNFIMSGAEPGGKFVGRDFFVALPADDHHFITQCHPAS